MNSVIMRRKEVMNLLGLKTIRGFTAFVSRNPTFPKEQKVGENLQSRIIYPRRAVMIWLKNNGFIDALA